VPHEFIAIFECEKWIIKIHFRNPWNRSTNNIFDARLCRRRHRDGVAVATQSSSNPEDVDFRNGRRILVRTASSIHQRKIFLSIRPVSAAQEKHASIFSFPLAAVKADAGLRSEDWRLGVFARKFLNVLNDSGDPKKLCGPGGPCRSRRRRIAHIGRDSTHALKQMVGDGRQLLRGHAERRA